MTKAVTPGCRSLHPLHFTMDLPSLLDMNSFCSVTDLGTDGASSGKNGSCGVSVTKLA